MKKAIIILIFFVFAFNPAKSQISSAYEGTRFLLSFMQNENYIQQTTGLELALFITSKYNATVTIEAPFYPPQTYYINKDSVFKAYIDEKLEMYQSEVPLRNAVVVTSDLPITITAYSSQWKTTDSYAAIPVDKWGTEYVVLSQPNDQYQPPPNIPPEDSTRLAYPRVSEFLVIADEDSTVIEFRPRAVTWLLKQTFRHYQVTLNKGECYLVKSYPLGKGMGDLTGTIVTSNKPIGFLSGHVRTAIPQFLGPYWDSKNHLVEMLQPVSSWGRRFATVKMLPPSFVPYGDMIRITAFEPHTNITLRTALGYKSLFLRDSGDFISLPLFKDAAYWISDKPIQIGQYLMHSGENADSYLFDPALVTIPPIEQYIQRVIFQTPGNPPINPEQFAYHFVLLIANRNSLNSLTLDGKLVSNIGPILTQKIPGTDYHYVRLRVSRGKHEIVCQKGNFSGILFGVGEADAYAHVIGSSLDNPFAKDTIPPVISIDYECGRVNGFAFEPRDEDNSGLEYAMVIEDSTFNFIYDITPITDTTTYVKINASVIDVTEDGVFIIDIRDKNGNGERYRFVYNKLQVSIPPEFDFGDIDANDSLCKNFTIINRGNDTILVKNTYIAANDTRLIYVLSEKLPYYLPPGDTIHGTICFEPSGDTTELDNQFVILYDCDLLSRIPIKAHILNYDLIASSYDFGLVRVGDTVCSTVYIVNNGNSPIVIDSLEYANNQAFSLDSAGIFPATILPDDTLFVKVCFYPDSVKNYGTLVFWRNGKVSNIRSSVIGMGAAPHFESIVIDWFNRRVGTTNDTIIVIKNTGNLKGTIKYKSTLKDDDKFNRIDLLAVNYALAPGDSVELNSSFLPVSVLSSNFEAEYEVDWDLHPAVTIELIGNAVIPGIKTFDIDFGQVIIYSSNDTVANIIESNGTEILLIEKLYSVSPDMGDFTLDFLQFDNLTVPTGTILNSLISFSPQSLGYHERVIAVIHDAVSNYGRDTAYFKLMGVALPADTIDYQSEITGEDNIITCQNDIYTFSITNKGNIDLVITNMDLTGVNLSAEWVQKPVIPYTLELDSTKYFDIDVTSDIPGTGIIKVDYSINDTINESDSKQINVSQDKIVLGEIKGFKTTPGDSVLWEIKGLFPVKTNQPIEMTIELNISMRDYLVIGDNYELILVGNGFTRKIQCSLEQTIDQVFIKSDEKIILSEDSIKWSILLPFYVFLSENRNPNIEIFVMTDKCLGQNTRNILTEISEVCIINWRAVIADNTFLNVSVSPNPAADRMKCEFEVSENMEAEIEIFDINGKKSYYYTKIFLKKGNNSRIFETSSLTNGVYVINISTQRLIRNKIIVIKK